VVRQTLPGEATSPVILAAKQGMHRDVPIVPVEDMFTRSCRDAGLTVTQLSDADHLDELTGGFRSVKDS
jgi:hypothetical protein